MVRQRWAGSALAVDVSCYGSAGRMSTTERSAVRLRGRWWVYHFSQAQGEGSDSRNVAKLLRRVATSIATLGPAVVHDITFHADLNSEGQIEPSVTVYYELPGERSRPPKAARRTDKLPK
jgi:hypothetical protein